MKKYAAVLTGAGLIAMTALPAFAAGLTGSVTGSVSSTLGAAANSATDANVGTNASAGMQGGNANMSASGSAIIDSEGNPLGISSANGTLSAQVNAGTMTSSSEAAIVDLSGNTDSLINSSADLDAYDSMVVQERPAITNITAQSDGSVSVDYRQPAKLFGLFPTTIGATMVVNADGTSNVQLPWWAFMYSADTGSVQTAVQSAVSTDASAMVGAGAQATAAEQAHLVDDATMAINNDVNGSVDASTNADMNANAGANAAANATVNATATGNVSSQ